MSKVPKQGAEAIDGIRQILIKCHNRRLKAFLLMLASGGMRTIEALAIRLKDIDFSGPTRIHMRADFCKTKRNRDIFISDEAAKELQYWINSNKTKSPDDLVFQKWQLNQDREENPSSLYSHFLEEFNKVRKQAGFASREKNWRHETFNSLRRSVKSTLSEVVSSDYSEWFLGHDESTYWRKKPEEKGRIYLENAIKHLTFLDRSVIEAKKSTEV